jgi:membrane glycosyltransferase
LLVFGLATLVLLIPKILALLDLALDRERSAMFGGIPKACLSAFLELIYSTLQAPVLMLWHTEFVAGALLGVSVSWKTQNRSAAGTIWSFAFRNHWKHSAVGLIWGIAVWRVDPPLLAWMSPILAGLLLAIPLTVLTSRSSAGERARKSRLFLTPEETFPSEDIMLLRSALAEADANEGGAGVPDAIADPYVNALHISLLETAQADPTTSKSLQSLAKNQLPIQALREKVLAQGFDALTLKETLYLLSDLESMRWLHREFWMRPQTADLDR